MKNFNPKPILKPLILGFIAFGFIGLLLKFSMNIALFSKASASNGKIFFSPGTMTSPVDAAGNTTDVSVPITLTTDVDSIYGVDVVLKYNPAEVLITDIIPQSPNTSLKTFLPLDSTGTFDKTKILSSANLSGVLKFSAVTYDNTQKSVGTAFTGSTQLATLKFHPLKQSGSTTINFDFTPNSTTDTNLAGSSSPPTDILNSASGLVITMNPPVPTPTIILPTNAPTLTATPKPTSTPVSTSTPTPRPTSTPIPTSTPSLATPTPTPVSGVTQSVGISISQSADDVNEDGSNFTTNDSSVWLGNAQGTSYTGFRFNNVRIPKGAVIQSAKVQFFSPSSSWIAIQYQLNGELSPNSQPFSAQNKPSTRVKTSNKVNHSSNVKWSSGQLVSTDSISPVIQEIVNQQNWTSGNSIAILLKGTGSQWGRKFVKAYDAGAASAPQLVVTYTTR